VEWHGRIVESAIWKEPVEGRVAVRGVLVDGDEQADLRVHGGTDKAVYAYALEDYEWWSARLDRALEPGTFGENVTVAGFDPSDAVIGSRWRVGHTVLQVTEPRLPCFKLGMRMGDAAFVDDFAEAGRFGAYLSTGSPSASSGVPSAPPTRSSPSGSWPIPQCPSRGRTGRGAGSPGGDAERPGIARGWKW